MSCVSTAKVNPLYSVTMGEPDSASSLVIFVSSSSSCTCRYVPDSKSLMLKSAFGEIPNILLNLDPSIFEKSVSDIVRLPGCIDTPLVSIFSISSCVLISSTTICLASSKHSPNKTSVVPNTSNTLVREATSGIVDGSSIAITLPNLSISLVSLSFLSSITDIFPKDVDKITPPAGPGGKPMVDGIGFIVINFLANLKANNKAFNIVDTVDTLPVVFSILFNCLVSLFFLATTLDS